MFTTHLFHQPNQRLLNCTEIWINCRTDFSQVSQIWISRWTGSEVSEMDGGAPHNILI